MSSGQRLNKTPGIIVAVIIGVALIGIYYAATQRSAPKVAKALGEESLPLLESGSATYIEVIEGRPDGLVGVSNPLTNPEDDAGRPRVSNLDERLLSAYESQQVKKMQTEAAMREEMINRQIAQARNAIEGETALDAFGTGSSFARQREALVNRPVLTEIPANAYAMTGHIPQPSSRQTHTAESRSDSERGTEQSAISVALAQLPEEYHAVVKALLQRNQLTAAESVNASMPTENSESAEPFVTAASRGRDFSLGNKVELPTTRYEIKTGGVLPAAMISAANSDLPGDIVAQITQNIYDTQTGRYLLIPQGSKLFGRYDAYVSLGQTRLLVVWDRIIFPDAETLDIGGMQGYDGRGLSGMEDKVNTHFFQTLLNAFLISTVDAAGESLRQEAEKYEESFVVNLAHSFGVTASRPFDDYLRQRLKIKPTLEIRAGYRFNILVSKDITFVRPYKYGYTMRLTEQ